MAQQKRNDQPSDLLSEFYRFWGRFVLSVFDNTCRLFHRTWIATFRGYLDEPNLWKPGFSALSIQSIYSKHLLGQLDDIFEILIRMVPDKSSLTEFKPILFEEKILKKILERQPDVIILVVRDEDLESLAHLYWLLTKTKAYHPMIITKRWSANKDDAPTKWVFDPRSHSGPNADYFLSLARKPPPMN